MYFISKDSRPVIMIVTSETFVTS